MSFLKQYGTSAKGNDRLLKKYGGNDGNSPMARQKYAQGGRVGFANGGNPSLAEGVSAASGPAAKPSLSRPGRKAGKGKDAGKGKTNINIIIAGKDGPGGPPPGPPMGGPPPGPPMMAKPPMPPPMPPPGAGPGGPPMPMKASGGAVARYAKGGRIANLGKFAHGGKIKRADGGETDPERDKVPANPGEVSNEASAKYLRDKGYERATKAAETGAVALGVGLANRLPGAGRVAKGIGHALTGTGAGLGAMGAVQAKKKFDEADKFERAGRKEGGPVMGLHMKGKTVGSGGGLGRLAKMRKYGA